MRRTLPPLFLLLLASPAVAQPAATLDRAIAAHDRVMGGVENYALTQRVTGHRHDEETTTYFEREGGDVLAYAAAVRTPNGWEAPGGAGIGQFERGALLRALRGHVRAADAEAVNGEETVAVTAEGFGALAQGIGGVPDAGDMEIEAATLYFGADDHLLRRVSMTGTALFDGPPFPIAIDVVYSDFRTVGEMRHPFRTTISTWGMEGAIPAEERDRMRMEFEDGRAQRERLLRELEEAHGQADTPEEQREIAEMLEQLRQPSSAELALAAEMRELEAMLGGAAMETVVEVADLQVNAGRPD